MPEEAQETKEQGEAVEDIVRFILFQDVGQFALVTIKEVVDDWKSGKVVAIFFLTEALHAILTAGKVPQEITPIHEVKLIGREETEVAPLRRHLPRKFLPAWCGERNVAHGDIAAHPILISLGMMVIPNAREEHREA